jgi:hypothetical protein
MDRLVRLAAEIKLSRAMSKEFKYASDLLDKLNKQPKKPLGTRQW